MLTGRMFFFVGEGLGGIVTGRSDSDWCDGKQWTSRDHVLMPSLEGTFRPAAPQVHWTTATSRHIPDLTSSGQSSETFRICSVLEASLGSRFVR